MKVLFDARWILVENRFDGVSRYSTELAHALAAREDVEVAWLVYDQRQVDKLPAGKVVWANNPSNILKEFFTLARTINKSGHELVYSPFFMIGTLGKKFKLILTIHDMIYFTHRTPPQWLPWHIRLGWRLFHITYWPMRWQLNKADAIATVSDTARQELIDANATKRPITTVSNAVGNQFYDPTPRERHTLTNIVFIGAFTPYKNVECLLDMMPLLPDMTLHLCGKLPPARRPSIEAQIEKNGITDRVVLYDGATDDEYRQALASSCCAISASRLEGFGLPVIEAQSAGVPYACADTPIFREIGADSVLYFDPNDPFQAAECVMQFQIAAVSQEYITKGYQNSMRYTWDTSAAAATAICRSIS